MEFEGVEEKGQSEEYFNNGGEERKAEAIECFQRALAIDPNNAETLHKFGVVLSSLEKRAEAIECFQRALAIDPNNAETHHNLGVAFQVLERKAEAVECYQKALALKPEYS